MKHLTTLLRHTNGLSATTSSLGVLTTDTNTPEMSETPVAADLLQPLEIVPEFGVDIVGQYLAVLAIDDILLSVQEPKWDLELRGVLHDVHDSFELVRVQVTGALLQVNIGLFAYNVGVPTTHTLDLSQSILDLALAINVGVE